MNDTPSGFGDDDPDPELVQDWLREIAESEGISRDEAVEELLSAYWQLTEIAEVFDGRPNTSLSDASVKDSETFRPKSKDGRSDLETVVGELSSRMDRLDKPLNRSSSHQATDLAEEVSELRTRLDSVERSTASVKSEVDELSDAIVRTDDFEAFRRLSKSFQGAISNRQEKFENRVKDEFENIRTIIEHLLDQTETSDPLLERTTSRFEARLDAIVEEREVVVQICQKAMLKGIDVAECEQCALTISIAQLRRPVCPRCGREFDELTTDSQLFGLWNTHVLTGEN